MPRSCIEFGSENRVDYSRELCCSSTRCPLGLDCTVDRFGDRVLCDEVTIRQFDLLFDTTLDSLPETPCGVNIVRHRQCIGKGTAAWVAKRVGIERPRVDRSESINCLDTRVYIPWRVETPKNFASERLISYLVVTVWAVLDAKFLRKESKVEGLWLLLER